MRFFCSGRGYFGAKSQLCQMGHEFLLQVFFVECFMACDTMEDTTVPAAADVDLADTVKEADLKAVDGV